VGHNSFYYFAIYVDGPRKIKGKKIVSVVDDRNRDLNHLCFQNITQSLAWF
jgi:hypothetical protein